MPEALVRNHRKKVVKEEFAEEGIKPGTVVAIFDPGTQKIIIPESMSKLDASNELYRQYEEDQKVAEYNRTFDGFHMNDVLVAIKKVCDKHFGWMNTSIIPGGFFEPDQHPEYIEIVTDVDDNGKQTTEKAFFGRLIISQWDNANMYTVVRSAFRAGVMVKGKKCFEKQYNEFFGLIEDHLRKSSIYKAKSIIMDKQVDPRTGEEEIQMTITRTKVNDAIVLNDDAEMVVNQLIAADLRTEKKRIYLFTGTYGNGKTETALRIGKMAVDKKYTFLYVKDPDSLTEVLRVAKKYMPVMVFMEDIDQVASGSDRGSKINNILNTLDGTELKGQNIKVVFTTNHANRLNEALRRPGRIDIVVQFNNPDKKSKAEIITRMLGHMDGFEQMDIDRAVNDLPDSQGAFIAEICSRAAQYGEEEGLTNDIFQASASSMRDHIMLMEEPVKDGEGKLSDAVQILGDYMIKGPLSEKANGALARK